MADQTPWCVYCLELLDSNDPNPERRALVQCQCGATYHAKCLAALARCLYCVSSETTAIQAFPKKTPVRNWKRPIPPPMEKTWKSSGDSLKELLLPSFQISRALIAAVILISLGVLIGIYTYRVIMLFSMNPGVTSGTILDAIIKAPMPRNVTTLAALVCGGVLGLIFYLPRLLKKRQDQIYPAALTKFVGGIVAIFWFDVSYFNVSPTNLPKNFLQILDTHTEPLAAQAATFVLLIVFLGLYHYLAPITFFKKDNSKPSKIFTDWFFWLRFLIVSLGMIGIAGAISGNLVDINLQIVPGFPNITGACIISLVLAALFYYPHLKSPRWVAFIRGLLVIGGGVGWGYLYSFSPYTVLFLQISTDAALLIFLAIPLQRTIS